jgi:hypothetical protein
MFRLKSHRVSGRFASAGIALPPLVAHVLSPPELPGCAADGATYQEALASVEVVIREWIETARELGRPIPEPRGRLIFA